MKKADPKAKAKQQKSEKRAKAFLTVIVCLVAICTAAVVAVGAFTDVFKQKSDVKAVALVLSQAEEKELEESLAKFAPLAEKGFDANAMGAQQLLSYIEPASGNGLYAAFGFGKAEALLTPDPAQRFADGEGLYSYYKISAEQTDSILSEFDIIIDHTVNCEDVYYYNGDYYFANRQGSLSSAPATADITASKRIQDGRYYVTCELGGKTVYVVVSKAQQESSWKIQEISLTPVFDQLGIMIRPEQNGLFDYDMKTQVIEGKAQDNKVYCRYVLTYPVFYGDTAGEAEANRFYQSMLTYYTQQVQGSEKQYKQYIKKGGLESALPLEVNFTAEVTYTSGAYIAVTNEISETEPLYKAQSEEENTASAVVPSKKTVECHTFDTETGAYISKDNIIGKDYQLIEELLYRIYCGYDYAALLDENAADSQVIPDDMGGLGEKIYSSASTFSSEGYMFCYINDSGYRQDVVIPFSAGIFQVEI